MTKEIKKALKEVRKYFPNVTTVVFNKYGQWNYCDDNFNSPNFEGSEISQSLLEEASDSVESLPCVFCI